VIKNQGEISSQSGDAPDSALPATDGPTIRRCTLMEFGFTGLRGRWTANRCLQNGQTNYAL